VALVVAAYTLIKRPIPTAQLVSPAVPSKPAPREKSKQDMIADVVRKQDGVLNLSNMAQYYSAIGNDDIRPLENATNAIEINLTGALVGSRTLPN
jgi:hypothetical protein